jgi:hypothetical protein
MIEAFREHIAEDSVDFDSAFNVTLAFLASMAGSGHCQLGFFVEAASFLTEGLARHRHGVRNLAARVYDELRVQYGVRPLRDSSLAFLKLSIDGAVERAKLKRPPLNFKGKVLFCGSPPWLMSGITHQDTAELLQLEDGNARSPTNDLAGGHETSGKPIEDID